MKSRALLLLTAAVITAVLFIEPIPQDPGYHEFADTRRLLGVANFWNVFSNIALVLTGIAGLTFLKTRQRAGILVDLYPIYVGFFAGVFLSGFGSAWYHLAPANESLVWDRLPMTLAFMSFFAIIIGERISTIVARRWFIPLLTIGAGSVLYWYFTETSDLFCGSERAGPCGDLRPYALVQFLPMLLIPLLLVSRRSPFDRSAFVWVMILLYASAKLFEYGDRSIFDSTAQLISGHSIKHLAAAAAALVFLSGLSRRRPAAGGTQS